MIKVQRALRMYLDRVKVKAMRNEKNFSVESSVLTFKHFNEDSKE